MGSSPSGMVNNYHSNLSPAEFEQPWEYNLPSVGLVLAHPRKQARKVIENQNVDALRLAQLY